MKDNRQSKNWMKLDNAAKIYPASRSGGWMATFRLSASLTEEIDPVILAAAEERTARRFPSFCLRLRRGFFWYYLETIDTPPIPEKDVKNPCANFDFEKTGGYCFRVRYHENRIALEFFHVITDGTGGLVFLKTLVAEYLELKYGVKIPRGDEILDCNEAPRPEELEDCYLKHARKVRLKRRDESSYRQKGEKEEKGIINVVTAITETEGLLKKAKSCGATVTEYLTAHLIAAYRTVQLTEKKKSERIKPIKICIPVNLRRFYGAKTLRNFAEFVNVGIDCRLGEYEFNEIIKTVHHQMGLYINEKYLNSKISANVGDERNALVRVVPLFIKDMVLKIAFKKNGDRTSATTLSNLGRIVLPDEMSRYITRFDFMLGALSKNPSAFATVSYGESTVINMVRSIVEADVEREFCRRLVKDGIHIKVESNR
ncbi:MAG: alcohol acetyltransferase [Clostridia bacterium]|nr:alcohol acetyltransferase [Clostridia bacterium]